MHWLVLVVLTLSIFACGLTTQTSNAGNTPRATVPPVVEATATAIQSTLIPTIAGPLIQPTIPASATSMTASVTITAINGNLYIRRGSGSDFNPVGALLKGESAIASGRDILDEWLYIPIPSEAGKSGWVSMQTIYSSINGRPMDLPVVDSDLAVPAFIQNCSTHNMIVWPSGVIIPPVYQFPDNIIQFDPGDYSVQDYDNGKSNPNSDQGIAVDLREGEQYRITAMGTAAQHKCPEGQ